MSAFLDSILDSIDGKAPATRVQGAPRTAPAFTASPVIVKTPGSLSGEHLKRKADSSLDGTSTKVQRTNVPYKGSGPKAPYAGSGLKAAPVLVSASKPAPKPAIADSSINIKRLIPTPMKDTANRPQPATTVQSSASAAQPKKGSYAEIMARAQNQANSGATLGAIKHKPAEKLTPAQRKARLEEATKKKRQDVLNRGRGKKSRSSSPAKSKTANSAAPKAKKQPVDLGYKGTMRPAPGQPSHKGTVRPVLGSFAKQESSLHQSSKTGGKTRMAGYASYSEDDVDQMEEDWDDLSDMEAGLDELETEEFESRRLARMEDLQAQREEEEHRRKKLERKSRR